MDHDAEIIALAAETLALQAILTNLCAQLARTPLAPAIRQAFDDAASEVEHLAIKLGERASPKHTVEALRIVEQLRSGALRDAGKPPGSV